MGVCRLLILTKLHTDCGGWLSPDSVNRVTHMGGDKRFMVRDHTGEKNNKKTLAASIFHTAQKEGSSCACITLLTGTSYSGRCQEVQLFPL